MKQLKNILIFILVASAFAAAYIIISKSLGNEQPPQFVIMPEGEFSENPVLFREEDGTLSVPEIGKENARAIIASIKKPENMFWSCKRTLYSGASTTTRIGIYRKRGSKFRAEVQSAAGETLRTVIFNGSRVYSKVSSGASRTASYSEQYKPEAVMGFTDLDYFLNAPASAVTLAEIRIVDSKTCLYVEYDQSEVGQKDSYYISLHYGVILKAETKSGGEVVYSAETLSVSDAEQADSFFRF